MRTLSFDFLLEMPQQRAIWGIRLLRAYVAGAATSAGGSVHGPMPLAGVDYWLF